ncbi:sulfatase [Bacteroidia bacterium]|nr:sulfatase [Bacteroidia bacterium]
MLYNAALAPDCGWLDYLEVMFYGLTLDSTMSAYLVVLPFLLVGISIWVKKLPFRKILIAYYAVIALLISVAFVMDMTLYAFWNFKLDTTPFIYSPSDGSSSVPWFFIPVRVLIACALAVLLFRILWKITPKRLSVATQKIADTLGMIALSGVLFVTIRGGVSASSSNIGRAYFSDKLFLNHSAVNPLFSFFYSLGKSDNFAEQFNFFPEAEREQLFDGLYPTGEGTTEPLLKIDRPNVLIILWESFGGNFTEAIGENAAITPNFNQLTKEGIFFENYYSNSFRTDRGTICALSGYPGLPTVSVMKLPVKSQTLPSIAKTLSKAGYKTDFLYGGDINFTNMQSYFRSTGYQKITADVNFSLKDRVTNAWGVNDEITFNHLYQQIQSRKDSPWHTGFLTLSSHEPFRVPYHRLADKITNAFAYTDNCLGEFIARLKKTPAWDNLLIIIMPDHGSPYPHTLTVQNPDFFYTPMLWLGGAVAQPVKVEKLVNQTDVSATLLAQLHLPHDDFKFSRDVFNSDYTYPFAFFSFNNGMGFRDSTGVSVYDNVSGTVIFEQPATNENRVNRAKAILQTVYDDLGTR